MLESFRQPEVEKRTLMVDDWHSAALNGDGRRAFLSIAEKHFGKIVLFVGEMFHIQELVEKSTDTTLSYHNAQLQEFGTRFPGVTRIDKWVTWGREHSISLKKKRAAKSKRPKPCW